MSSKDVDRTEALRRELVDALNQRLQMGERMAMPIADAVIAHLQDQYAGERIYVPQPTRRYDLLAIEAELRRGDPPEVVARRHATSPRNLRRLFPGGLPKPDRVA